MNSHVTTTGEKWAIGSKTPRSPLYSYNGGDMQCHSWREIWSFEGSVLQSPFPSLCLQICFSLSLSLSLSLY